MTTKKLLGIILIIAVVVAVLAIGLSIGKKQGRTEGEEQYRGLVDRAYPKPPNEMMDLSGIIKAVSGATIDLEIIDPDDYLPHPDGTPQRKEIRFATVTSATKYILKDYKNPDAEGNPGITELVLSDLKPGFAVTVKSDGNIRDAEKFDVHTIEVVIY